MMLTSYPCHICEMMKFFNSETTVNILPYLRQRNTDRRRKKLILEDGIIK